MEFYVYDSSLTPQGIIEKYTSLQWQRWFYKAGEFELVCALTESNLSLLKKGNIIWPKGDPEAGFIYYRKFDMDDTGQETIDVKGYFLTGYLKRRIVWDSLYLTGTAENVMRQLVDNNAINPTISGRAIPLLSLGALHSLAPTGTYQTPDDNSDRLSDVLETQSTAADVGHRILFDPKAKALTFDVWQGLDRTVSQSANPRAVFCREYENVLTQEYTDSNDDYYNVCLVGGKFTSQTTTTTTNSDGTTSTDTSDAVTAVSTIVGTVTGLDRYEEYLSSSSSSKIDTGTKDSGGNEIDNYLSQTDFITKLQTDGTTELAQHTETQTFDSTVNLYGNLVYKTDWDLGDKVTFVSKKWGVQIDTRITGVKEVYESTGLSLEVTFGNDVPTLIDKIKKAVK